MRETSEAPCAEPGPRPIRRTSADPPRGRRTWGEAWRSERVEIAIATGARAACWRRLGRGAPRVVPGMPTTNGKVGRQRTPQRLGHMAAAVAALRTLDGRYLRSAGQPPRTSRRLTRRVPCSLRGRTGLAAGWLPYGTSTVAAKIARLRHRHDGARRVGGSARAGVQRKAAWNDLDTENTGRTVAWRWCRQTSSNRRWASLQAAARPLERPARTDNFN